MNRKKIAVFISALYEDMVMETVQGLLSAARDENLKLVFFTSFADNHTSRRYDRYQDYDTGDFVVYLLPDLKEYDVLISFDTYMTGFIYRTHQYPQKGGFHTGDYDGDDQGGNLQYHK